MRLKTLGGLFALTMAITVLLLALLVGGAAGGHGTWKAEDVVSWSPGLSHGIFEGGTLVIHATLKPRGQAAIKNVMIEIDCNLGPAGFTTGKPEGVVVTVPGGPTFIPTNPTTGVTV